MRHVVEALNSTTFDAREVLHATKVLRDALKTMNMCIEKVPLDKGASTLSGTMPGCHSQPSSLPVSTCSLASLVCVRG